MVQQASNVFTGDCIRLIRACKGANSEDTTISSA